MKILCDSGLVVSRKEGKWMHYALSREGFAKASACLEAFSSGELPESEKG
jgi:ArsR family transcriptional regulator